MSNERNDVDTYSPEARDVIVTVPNLISLLRLISIPFVAWLIAERQMLIALIVLAVGFASDGLDGILARKLNQVSKIGQILDPIADRMLILCSVIALGISGIVPWWLIIVIGLRDLVMAVQVLWLAQYDYGPLPVHFVGKAGTALLMMAIVALMVADMGTNQFFVLLHIAALAAGIWGVFLYWLAGYIYFRQGFEVLRREVPAGKAAA